MDFKSKLIAHPNFPKSGITFQDVLPLFSDPETHQALIDNLVLFCGPDIDVIVGLETRGYLFGPSMALALKVQFEVIRKAGKLPGNTLKVDYVKEYGTDTFEMATTAIRPGQRVVIVDDLLATGGTAEAACRLVRQMGGVVIGLVFIVELTSLNARNTKLKDECVCSLVKT